jgi:sulfide:quinone oxidoreductase
MARVLVLGGGFGGLAAVTRLRGQLSTDDEVVLVARDDRFAMGFAKLWDLAGLRPLEEGTRSLHRLADRGVRFVHAEITRVDGPARAVVTSDGELEGDAMIVALGTRSAPAHRELLAGRDAYDLYDPAELPGMRSALEELGAGRVVVAILGGPFRCPPAPYEAALIVDQLLRDRGVRSQVEVLMVTPQPMALPSAGIDASRYVAGHLGDRDVALRSGVRVAAVDADERILSLVPAPGQDGRSEELGFDLLLGVPADAPPDVLHGSGLVGPSGWIEPDPATLRTHAERVYAVGDCTVIPTATAQLPHAGVFAAGQARVAAANVVAELAGGAGQRFDGHGYCFLELPGEQVAYLEGDFYAAPPQVTLQPADHAQFRRKQRYELEHLEAWLG